jgi:serine/threonine protein phosphatase PrpC
MVTGGPRAALRPEAAADAASPRWHVVGRSARGASHLRSGAPNQDAVEVWPPQSSGTPVIAAVADGHGGSRHFRSADGARMAVAATTRILREIAPRFDALSDAERSRLAAVEVPPRIVEAWVQAVRADLARQPLTPEELAAVAAAEGAEASDSVRDDPLLAYGATLLAVLVTPRCCALFQLGDGDVLSVAADGTTTRPIPRDERLGGNLTTSLCRAGAEADFRCVVSSHEQAQARPALILLSTDGYANSFRTDADYLEVGRDFLELIRQHGIASIADKLPQILDHASQHGSGDDITLALLWRAAAGVQ